MSEFCKEIVTLIIYDDEGREILHINLANSLHTKLWEVYNLDRLDRVLREDCSRTTDRAELEAAICLASISNSRRTVTLSYHNHRATVLLEEVYIRVHTTCGSRTE